VEHNDAIGGGSAARTDQNHGPEVLAPQRTRPQRGGLEMTVARNGCKLFEFLFYISLLTTLFGCSGAAPVRFDERWPATTPEYQDATERWMRKATLRSSYQESLDLVAIFKSPEWRAAHAEREAEHRRLVDPERTALVERAKADAEGPHEFELLVTTWDRRENDLDRGSRSVWHLALVDDSGHEHEPIEVVKDKRAPHIVRAEFPAFGDFATAYRATFPRTALVLGPNTRAIRLRMSSERGGVELVWASVRN